MRVLKILVFVLLSVLHLAMLGVGLMLYTSLFKCIPWHEPCGMQLLGILMPVAPALAFIGFLLILLGFILPLSKTARFLPFLNAGLLALPLALDRPLSTHSMVIIGTGIASLLILVTLCTTGHDIIHLTRGRKADDRT